jgi:glycosyltransferase involved in cell wall biosynthesis
VYAWEFARALRDGGARVDFLTARESGQEPTTLEEGIRILRAGDGFGYYPRTAARLWWRRFHPDGPYDVVIDSEHGIPMFAPLVTPRRTAIVLVMHHVHLDQFGLYFPRWLSAIGRWLEGTVMPRVYRGLRTVAVSPSTVAEMRERLGWRGHVDVLHNGADLPTQVAAEREHERVIVFGRLAAHKRVDVALAALAQVARARPGLHVDVVGRGPEEARVAEAVHRLRLEDRVTLHGFLPDVEKDLILARSSLNVCASDAEGWGQVVIAAAASGVPTVARDVPGLRDSVINGRTGWLLPPGSDDTALVSDLATAIDAALTELSDPRRRGQIEAACREQAARYTWPAFREQARRVVVEELNARPRKPWLARWRQAPLDQTQRSMFTRE